MSDKWRLVCKLLLLVILLVPTVVLAHTPSFTYGNPCHEESTIYYSDATYTVVVGGNQYYCWWGHHVWGEWTPYSTYTYHLRCCATHNCVQGLCRLE
jgi:hypothetical protein